jgi:hypothetical protein
VSPFAIERYNAAMPRRVALIACLGTLLLVGAFLFLHTGARADGVCMRELFVPAGGVSLWPPGTSCTYGEPARTDVLVNWWFGVVLGAVLVGSVAALGPRSAPSADGRY